MKQIKFYIYVVLVCLILVGSACIRQELDPYRVEQISDEFRAYSAFDSLSYWVYRKEGAAVNNVDTVAVAYVLKDRRFHIDDTDPDGYLYDAIEMYTASKLTGIIKYDITVGTPHNGSTSNENLRIYFSNGRYYRVLIPKYPNGEIQFLGPEEGNYMNIEKIASMNIFNKTYTEIYHTRIVDYKDAPDTTIWNFYLAKNYGLVRFTRVQQTKQINDIWELYESNLIPYTK